MAGGDCLSSVAAPLEDRPQGFHRCRAGRGRRTCTSGEPIAPPEGRLGPMFVRVRGHQRGVDVHQRLAPVPVPRRARQRPTTRPHRRPRVGTCQRIAATAASTSPARTANSRDTVGSEATEPKIAGRARTAAMSARPSHPARPRSRDREPQTRPGWPSPTECLSVRWGLDLRQAMNPAPDRHLRAYAPCSPTTT
jgi:hypothetical protein